MGVNPEKTYTPTFFRAASVSRRAVRWCMVLFGLLARYP